MKGLKVLVAVFLLVLGVSSSSLFAKEEVKDTNTEVLLKDDFSGNEIDASKWRISKGKGEGSFIKVEDGTVHVIGCNSTSTLTPRNIPYNHILEFDFYSSGGGGAYGAVISYITKEKKLEIHNWYGHIWYMSKVGSKFYFCSPFKNQWGLRGMIMSCPVDRWYKIRVRNGSDWTKVEVYDRATQEKKGEVFFGHEKAVAGRIAFCGNLSGGGRKGFKLDNIVIKRRGTKTKKEAIKELLLIKEFSMPESWKIKEISGKDFWHVGRRYALKRWKELGITDFLEKDTACRIGSHSISLKEFKKMFSNDVFLENLSKTGVPFYCPVPGHNVHKPYKKYEKLDSQVYHNMKQKAGENFLGFISAEWGLHWTDQKSFKKMQFKSREEATGELKKMWEAMENIIPEKGEIISALGAASFHHLAGEWGAKGLFAELGANMVCIPQQIAFLRGAARQYNNPWGVWISDWFWAYGGANVKHYSCNQRDPFKSLMFRGHSPSLHRRMAYLSYLSGTNLLWVEIGESLFVTPVAEMKALFGYLFPEKDDKMVLSPIGEVFKEVIGFAKKHFDRGVPYTPVAIMIDFDHGWSPWGSRYRTIYGKFPFKKGDHMMNEFFNTIYPWDPSSTYSRAAYNQATDNESGYLPHGPFGDIFDVIVNTVSANKIMDNYPVIMLVGKVDIDKDLAERLTKYVERGGMLVINAEQINPFFSNDLLGVRLKNETGESDNITCKLDNKTFKSNVYQYQKATLLEAEPLMENESGDVIAAKNKYGKGYLVLTTPAFLLGKDNKALPILKHLLEHITKGLLPVEVDGDVQYLVNKKDNGWLVTLINNKGVYKSPTEPPIVRAEEEAILQLTFKEKPQKVLELIENKEVPWIKEGAKVEINIPSGDLRIIEVIE